jgi:Glycosyltransferase family 87
VRTVGRTVGVPRWLATAGAAAAFLGHLAAVVVVFTIPGRPDDASLVTAVVVSWVSFAVAVALLLRVRLARPIATVTLLGAVLMVPGVLVEPQTSSDSYRYVWDGRVQLAGISPYRYVPRDPALVPLRDDYLWPDSDPRIGLASEPTIYPPVAQGWFAAVAAVTPREAGGWGIRVATAVVGIGVSVLLGRLLTAAGRDPRWSAAWAWCPLVLYEAGNNAHVDVVAVALVVAGFTALHRGRSLLAGAALGLAVATKLVPVIVAPVFARERPLRVVAAAVAVVAGVYLPHVLTVGAGVLGYLPEYVEEEGYDGTSRFRLLRLVVPDDWALPAALVVAAGVALVAWRRTDPRRPWDTATWLTGAALLVVSPTYHWYALVLVACVALSGRWEWLVIPVAVTAVYLAPDWYGPSAPLQVQLYSACLVVVAAATGLRVAVSRRRRARARGHDETRTSGARPS